MMTEAISIIEIKSVNITHKIHTAGFMQRTWFNVKWLNLEKKEMSFLRMKKRCPYLKPNWEIFILLPLEKSLCSQ